MDFLELVKTRYSVRKYKSDPVPEALLQKILQAARLAPTAANRQPFQLIVITSPEHRAALAPISDQVWFTEAPVVIAVVAETAKAWGDSNGRNFSLIDTAIVADHITLAAADLGLGTCWIGGFDLAMARKTLHLPAGVEPIIFIPIGYADDQPEEKERKPLKALVRYEQW
jgi:nitroreductase